MNLHNNLISSKPTSLVVIETEEEWGLSFNGHNPEQENYFKMPDKETAFRLKEKLSAKFPPVTRNSPVSSPSDKL